MTDSPVDRFKTDLIASLRAWRVAPALPFISMLLVLPAYLPGKWEWMVVIPLIFEIGWVGTQRLWYLRIFRGKSLALGEGWRITWKYFPRFLRLALLMGLFWFAVLATSFVFVPEAIRDDGDVFRQVPVIVAGVIGIFVTDVTLTFVTPALAFTTRRVRSALRMGLAMLRSEWPRCAWYALTPPLVGVVLVQIAQPDSTPTPVRMLVSVVSSLSVLWLKGATAAFYLRRATVSDSGAAFEEGPPPGSALGSEAVGATPTP